MVSLFNLLLLQVGSCAAVGAPAFASFIQQYSREYIEGSEEYEHRRSIYENRVKEAESLNSRPRRLWTAGVNHLTDWTDEELRRLRGWKGGAGKTNGMHGSVVSRHGHSTSLRQKGRASPLPDQISWANLNASSIIHNQGSCGSCWAVAASYALEANHEIHQKTSRTFSIQELVSCVPNTHNCGGTGGCDGATVDLAMDYVLKHGLKDSTDMPYKWPYSGSDHECSENPSLGEGSHDDDLEQIVASGVHSASNTHKALSAFGMTGWEHLPQNKYEPLMRALVEKGPVAISVAATPWQSYTAGIFDGCEPDSVIDHAVVLVGYGNDDKVKEKYWTIQNSWGDWGEDGRIRILRRDSDETECGIDHQPEVGTGCDGGPKQVTVCGMCGILYDTIVPLFADSD